MRPLSPLTMVKMASRVVTPMVTPRISSELRIRFPIMVRQASFIPSRQWTWGLFMTQRLHGIETGGLPGRIGAKHPAY